MASRRRWPLGDIQVGILEGRIRTSGISEYLLAFCEKHFEPEMIGPDDIRYFHFPSIEQLAHVREDEKAILECARIRDESPDAFYILVLPR
jgi:hypothetical protein